MGKYAILAASLLMIAASFGIGYWGKKKADTAQAYFGATGIFGPFATGLSTLGGIVSAFALVGVNGLVYNTGTGMGLWMLTAVSGPFGLMCLAKKVRAVQEISPLSSLGDVTDVIYNNSRIIKGVMSGILALGCQSNGKARHVGYGPSDRSRHSHPNPCRFPGSCLDRLDANRH